MPEILQLPPATYQGHLAAVKYLMIQAEWLHCPRDTQLQYKEDEESPTPIPMVSAKENPAY